MIDIKTAHENDVKLSSLKEAPLYSGVNSWPSIPSMQWYVHKFGFIPHVYDCGECVYDKIKDLIEGYPVIMSKTFSSNNKGAKIYAALYEVCASDGLYINQTGYYNREKEKLEIVSLEVLFARTTKETKELIDALDGATYHQKKTGTLNLLSKPNDGFELKEFPISCPDIDFELNYNSDFTEINNIIIERLNQDNGKGIVMLYGPPGTGKTSYIRYVVNKVEKRMIYMPPDLTSELSNPGLVPFLAKVPNSVLIVEDAESVLMKRQGQHSQAISNILNLSDGLLSDCLNIQIIATFNTSLKNVDEALMRKGRLIAKYEFDKLTVDRVKKLGSKLGVKIGKNVTPLTSAEIYNMKDKAFTSSRTVVGFKQEAK